MGWSSHERATFWSDVVGHLLVIGALAFAGIQIQKSNIALDLTRQQAEATNKQLELTNEQLELTNEQLYEAKYESVYGHQLNLWQLAVQTPEVAPYIMGGQTPPEGVPEPARVEAALANALDFYAFVFEQLAPRDDKDNLPPRVLGVQSGDPTPPGVDDTDWERWWAWAATILNGFETAPGMCHKLSYQAPSGGYVYDTQFIDAVKAEGFC